MIIQATMTSKNQITIPKAVRDLLKLKQSDNVQFNIDANNKVTIEKETSKDAFWEEVMQQQEKYGSIDTPEVNWGNNVGAERID